MIKGAIFDLDGTLLDSMPMWDTIGVDYLRSLGREPREDLKETFKTFTLEQSAKYYRAHYGVTLSVAEIVEGVNKMLADYYIHTVPLKSGVDKLLRSLCTNGVKMCVATVTDRPLAEASLIRLGVREYFSGILTCAEVGHGKEEPHIYREALACLGTQKEETVVFEDAYHALKTAANDGFRTAAVYDAHEERQADLKAFAYYYIHNYSTFSFESF